MRAFLQKPLWNKNASLPTNLATLMKLDTHLSRQYLLTFQKLLDTTIEFVPAYNTSLLYVPSSMPNTFCDYLHLIPRPGKLCSRYSTKLWTNNKTYNSRIRPDPYCECCSFIQTMKHLLHECKFYSEPYCGAGLMMSEHSTYVNIGAENLLPRVELGLVTIIFSIPHLLVLLCKHDKPTRNVFLLLTHKNQAGWYLQTQKPTPLAQQVTATRRLAAHLASTKRTLCSFLQKSDLTNMPKLLKLCHNFKNSASPCFFINRNSLWRDIPIPWQHLSADARVYVLSTFSL